MYRSLFQDDFAKELREVYRAALCNNEPDAVEKAMLEEYADCLADEEDAAVFWLVLAHEQWKAGYLTQKVKDQAAYWSTHGADLRFTEAAIQRVMQKIHEPMPSPKKRMPPKNICKDWNNGDVFRYDWSSPEMLPPELASKTLYVQRIGTYHAGRNTDPIVWFKAHIARCRSSPRPHPFRLRTAYNSTLPTVSLHQKCLPPIPGEMMRQAFYVFISPLYLVSSIHPIQRCARKCEPQ